MVVPVGMNSESITPSPSQTTAERRTEPMSTHSDNYFHFQMIVDRRQVFNRLDTHKAQRSFVRTDVLTLHSSMFASTVQSALVAEF